MHCSAFTTPAPLSAQASFLNGAATSSHSAPMAIPQVAPSRRSRVRMATPLVIEKKTAIVDSVRERLSTAEMIFSVPLPGLTVANVDELKNALPDGTTSMTVKNTLMRRAIAESGWEVAGDITKQSSIWIFVGDDIKGSVDAYTKFAKPLSRDSINGGVLEGTLYDSTGILAIAALPSKIELITTVARLIKAVPTKIARSIKQVPTKVARSVKLAFADDESDTKDGEPAAADS